MSTIATLAAVSVLGASVATGTAAVPPQPAPDAGATSAPFTAPQGESADLGWLVMPFSRDQLDQAKEQAGGGKDAAPAAPAGVSAPTAGDKGETDKATDERATEGKETEKPAAQQAPPAAPAADTTKPAAETAPATHPAPAAETTADQGQWWKVIFGGFGDTKTGTNTETPDTQDAKDGGMFAWIWTPSSWFGGGDTKVNDTPTTDQTDTKTEDVPKTDAPATDTAATEGDTKTETVSDTNTPPQPAPAVNTTAPTN